MICWKLERPTVSYVCSYVDVVLQGKSSIELVVCQSVGEVQLDGAERKLVSYIIDMKINCRVI